MAEVKIKVSLDLETTIDTDDFEDCDTPEEAVEQLEEALNDGNADFEDFFAEADKYAFKVVKVEI